MSRFFRISLGLSAASLFFAACQSKQKPDQQPTTTVPAAPKVVAQDSPGAWYRQYRGVLPSSTDSVTLHLTASPVSGGDVQSSSIYGSYSTAEGRLFELYDQTSGSPDSLVLVDFSTEAAQPDDSNSTWRLRRQGRVLEGTRAGQPVRFREVQPAGSIAFEARFFSDSVAAYPDLKTSPHAHQSLQALVPVNGPAELKANILRSLRGDTTAARPAPTLENYWREQQRSYAEGYRTDAAEMRTSAEADSLELPGYALRYDEQTLVRVLWNQAPLLSLGLYNYAYTGGAHGMNGTTVRSFDTRTGRMLRYPDIFRPGAEAILLPVLDRAVRRAFKLSPTAKLEEVLLVEQVPVTRNVFLTGAGVAFVYTPYEIASYAQGEIRVFVPFAELKAALQPGLPVGTNADIARR